MTEQPSKAPATSQPESATNRLPCVPSSVGRDPLDLFFAPRTVAVIGASEASGSVGATLLRNLVSTPFGGSVYPVNPKRAQVQGISTYPNVAAIPAPVDLAAIATPAPTVPDIIRECVEAGVKAAIVISAGFREAGAAGAALEQQIREYARQGQMRVIGPNCLGVMSPLTGLNATFADGMARPGNVAFISQSGALLTAVLDYSLREMIGFSTVASLGSMVDVGWGDILSYLGNDPRTESILLYMESVGDARAFLSAAREVALTKPIIAIKAGRTALGAKAATSHTGAMTGSDAVLDAAFQRAGVLRVGTIADLFYLAEALSRQPRPHGPRLAILTNAGGPGVLAADALILDGGSLAELAPETMQALNELLPPHWSHGNPIDILGDAEPERYAGALERVARDPNSDGLLVILTPQAMTDPTRIAEELRPYARIEGKPVLATWMGGANIAAGEAILNRAGIPTFPYPDTATRVFNHMWRHSANLNALYEMPSLAVDASTEASEVDLAAAIIEKVRSAGRTLLTEFESKALLTSYGIPTVETRVAASEKEAVQLANEFGYPVVLKLHSETITHKTEVNGVHLNLPDVTAVRNAYQSIQASVQERAGSGQFLGVTVQPMVNLDGYELILGSAPDPQFGPVLLFGTGGQLVEVYQDRALGLPPLTTTLARRMMEQTHIYAALQGIRGRAPVDLEALERLLVRFSELVLSQPWIREIDLNPLLASPNRLLALDARVVLYGSRTKEEALPRTAIRPYPIRYVASVPLRDGAQVTIRPTRPEDGPLLLRFHESHPDRGADWRCFESFADGWAPTRQRFLRLCFTDYDREIVLVAVAAEAENRAEEVIALARLCTDRTKKPEFALLVNDDQRNRGLGRALLSQLARIAREEKLSHLNAQIAAGNLPMRRICEKVGFRLRPSEDDPNTLIADLPL